MIRFKTLLVLVVLIACAYQASIAQTVGGPWWNDQWHYRLPVSAGANGYVRTNKVADFSVNFTTLLTSLGESGTLNDQSIRVVEVDGSGTVVDTNVVYQFDRDPAYNANSNALGTVAVLVSGTTSAGTTRFYHVYFDTAAGFTLPSFASLVTLTDNVLFEGQSSYQIDNQLGRLWYHKTGGGFAGMRDLNNVEWIGYTPCCQGAGEYRGIPNLGQYAHPGYGNGSSTILSQGPIKATIQTVTTDGTNARWIWEFYPTYQTMTLQQTGVNYWMLYEGTPAGALDETNGYIKNSAGQTLNLGSSFANDLPNPEWAYFGMTGQPRFLYLVHHENDTLIDHYRPFPGPMTVFGFGRDGSSINRYMSATPQRLTFGMGEDESQSAQILDNAFRELAIAYGSGNALPIQLGSFTARLQSTNRVRLDWVTVSETNNYGFEVQKSFGLPGNYQTIPNSLIPGHGTTLEPHQYSYVDVLEANGIWYYRLKQIDLDGTVHFTEPVQVTAVTGVEVGRVPATFAIAQNYPNPFNPSTTIRYELPQEAYVSLVISDVLGREIATLVSETKSAGYYAAKWNTVSTASGIYFARFTAFDAVGAVRFSKINKLILLK